MKKNLNMQLDEHMNLIQDIAFKSIGGISGKEIFKLRQTYQLDEYEYFNRIKFLYIVPLGFLGVEYKISDEVEQILFSYIHYIITELQLENMDSNYKIIFS